MVGSERKLFEFFFWFATVSFYTKLTEKRHPKGMNHLPSFFRSKIAVSFGEDTEYWLRFAVRRKTSWWFQPISKILVKLEHFPKYG